MSPNILGFVQNSAVRTIDFWLNPSLPHHAVSSLPVEQPEVISQDAPSPPPSHHFPVTTPGRAGRRRRRTSGESLASSKQVATLHPNTVFVLMSTSAGDLQGCENEMEDLHQGSSMLVAPKEELLEGDRTFHYYEEVTRLRIRQGSEKEEGAHPEKNEAEAALYWEGDSGREVNKVRQNIMHGDGGSRLGNSQWSSGVPDHQNIHSVEKVPSHEAAPSPSPALVRNETIHPGEKFHRYCGRSFSHSSSPTAHEEIHTGEEHSVNCVAYLIFQSSVGQDNLSRRESPFVEGKNQAYVFCSSDGFESGLVRFREEVSISGCGGSMEPPHSRAVYP